MLILYTQRSRVPSCGCLWFLLYLPSGVLRLARQYLGFRNIHWARPWANMGSFLCRAHPAQRSWPAKASERNHIGASICRCLSRLTRGSIACGGICKGKGPTGHCRCNPQEESAKNGYMVGKTPVRYFCSLGMTWNHSTVLSRRVS